MQQYTVPLRIATRYEPDCVSISLEVNYSFLNELLPCNELIQSFTSYSYHKSPYMELIFDLLMDYEGEDVPIQAYLTAAVDMYAASAENADADDPAAYTRMCAIGALAGECFFN